MVVRVVILCSFSRKKLRDGYQSELFFSASHYCGSIPQANFLINFRIMSSKHASHHYKEYNSPSINIPSIILLDHQQLCTFLHRFSKNYVWCAFNYYPSPSLRCTNIKQNRLISSSAYILLYFFRLLTFRCSCIRFVKSVLC